MSDLIDRKTVFDVIDKCILEKLEGDTVEIKEPLKLIMEIYRIPSAQPERKKGKWLVDEDGNMECPFCGNTCGFGNYCNECGADLRGDVDD